MGKIRDPDRIRIHGSKEKSTVSGSATLGSDKHLNSAVLQEGAVCAFLHGFRRLERLGSSLQLACLNSYLAAAGQNLTSLNCSAYVLFTADILVLRRSTEFLSLLFYNT